MEKKKDNRGGPGRGQGRKPKWGEPTKTVSFRVPVSLAENIESAENRTDRAYEVLKNEFSK